MVHRPFVWFFRVVVLRFGIYENSIDRLIFTRGQWEFQYETRVNTYNIIFSRNFIAGNKPCMFVIIRSLVIGNFFLTYLFWRRQSHASRAYVAEIEFQTFDLSQMSLRTGSVGKKMSKKEHYLNFYSRKYLANYLKLQNFLFFKQ